MTFTKADEINWICKHFDEMRQLKSNEERTRYILRTPLLLSMITIPAVTEGKGNIPENLTVFNYLDQLRTEYWSQPSTYPKGYGPIEKIVEQWRDGVIDYETAEVNVKDISCAGQLSPVYIKVLLHQWIDDLEIDLDFTMKSAKLAVDAVVANPLPSLSTDLMMQAAEGYVRLAHGSLLRRPDGSIMERAVNIGQWAVNVAYELERSTLEGEFLHLLGTLVLDAYAGNFGPTSDYAKNIDIWIARAKKPMPNPLEGFKLAKNFLENALPLRTKGSAYGQTTKAILEAIIYEIVYMQREEPNIDGLKQLAEVAKEHLDQDQDASHRNRIDELMSIYS